MKGTAAVRKIELLVGLDDAYGRSIARGVIRYAKTKNDWKLFGYGWSHSRLFSTLSELEGAKPDGVIARITDRDQMRMISDLRIPVVDVAGAYPGAGFHEVNNDDFLTGRKAGEYFRSLGFRSFAFCGIPEARWSIERKLGFLRTAAPRSGSLPTFERPAGWWKNPADGGRGLARFLSSLPRATAVFACNDVAGHQTEEACITAGIAVPAELAVLGVDDEDLVCELADPSLSSIRLDCETIGYRSAELLGGLLEQTSPGIRSGSPENRTVPVPPKEIMERESTRVVLTEDPLVSRAVGWIHANSHRKITVEDILRSVPASRRSLEKRFRRVLGRTLHDEILLSRITAAKRLLSSGNDPLHAVAEACGFGSLQRFHIAFKAVTGLSPGRWRKTDR